MTDLLSTSYSSRSTAVRGAKRHGMEDGTFDVTKKDDGRYYVVLTQGQVDARAEFDRQQDEAFAAALADEPEGSDPSQEEADAAEVEAAHNAPVPMPEAISDARADAEEDAIAGEVIAEAEALETADADEAEQAVAADADDAKDVAAKPSRGPTYKEIANYNRSAILKPLEFIHKFLDDNPHLTRKQAVSELVGKGINYSTARTQYQRWFTKRKG